mgnify:CR=1 FL=1
MTKQKVKTPEKYTKLKELFAGKRNLLIVLQDHPDPDAVASGVALRRLANIQGINSSIACSGLIGRWENRALINYLNLNIRALQKVKPHKFDLLALVDTQPRSGNNRLTTDKVADIVIDHHPIRNTTRSARFTDVRSGYGATATILVEYLESAGIEPDPPLATALLYGIISDTQDLGRRAKKADFNAHFYVSRYANLRMLAQIRHGTLPDRYYKLLYTALENARYFGTCITTHIGVTETPDVTGEIADLLVRREGIIWCLCTAVNEHRLLLSLRSNQTQEKDAGEVISRIVGNMGSAGGHHFLAGGQIPLETESNTEVSDIQEELRRRMKTIFGHQESRATRLIHAPNPPR